MLKPRPDEVLSAVVNTDYIDLTVIAHHAVRSSHLQSCPPEVLELKATPAQIREFITTPERILDYYPNPIEGGVLDPGRAIYCRGKAGHFPAGSRRGLEF